MNRKRSPIRRSRVRGTCVLVAASAYIIALLKGRSGEGEQTAARLRRGDHDEDERGRSRTVAREGLVGDYESILDAAGEGIWGLDRDGRTVFANRVAAELCGYSSAELLSAPRVHDLMHHTRPDGSPYALEECPVQKSLVDGTVHEVRDELYFRKDGSSFPVEYTSTPIWEDGEVSGAVVVFRDVTQRREVERALRRSEERTRQILATAHDAFVSVDKDGCIVDWNAAAEEVFGWPRVEALGRPFAETLVSPTAADGGLGGSFSGNGHRRLGDRRIELIGLHRDGREFPIELTISSLRFEGDYVFNVFARDITERREAALQLEQERDFLDAVLESLKDGVMACGADGTLSLFNRATREMHGIAEEQLPPEEWASRYDLFERDGHTPMGTDQIPLLRALWGERVRDIELVISPEDRPPRTVLCNGQPIESKDGRKLGAVVAMHDVTERKRAEQQLVHQALHDSLTGLPNRALLLDRLRHALTVARRRGTSVAVVFADLDDFKRVNESLGHDIGDELLVAVASRLDQVLRAVDTFGRPGADTVARLGGDEFVVLCEGLTNERDATRIAERMAETLKAPFVVGGEEVFASASMGIAISSGEGTTELLLRDADSAMSRAKQRGRGGCELFDEAAGARVGDRLRRENELRRAIAQGELRLCFQPIVSIPDRRVVAAEALVSWAHPERGLLLPAEFIQLAEESGLIVPLGSWVLEQACRQSARWEHSFGEQLPLDVSVNISARQLADPDIFEELGRLVSVAGSGPNRIALELTETVLMEDGGGPVAKLEALKRLCSRLVLDDFGTGYSSLSYLRRLPLDTLKLDRSFVAPLTASTESRGIAAAVVQMGQALNMKIVAEGVETEDQLRILEELGYDMAQGYLFARPMPAEAMTDLLAAATAAPRTRQAQITPDPDAPPAERFGC